MDIMVSVLWCYHKFTFNSVILVNKQNRRLYVLILMNAVYPQYSAGRKQRHVWSVYEMECWSLTSRFEQDSFLLPRFHTYILSFLLRHQNKTWVVKWSRWHLQLGSYTTLLPTSADHPIQSSKRSHTYMMTTLERWWRLLPVGYTSSVEQKSYEMKIPVLH